MKKLLVVLVLVLAIHSKAEAVFTSDNPDVVSIHNKVMPTTSIGNAYNDGWWYPAGSSYLGPANRGGFAYGFSVNERYKVSSITGFVKGLGDIDRYGVYGNGGVSFQLHKGSVYGHDNIGPLPSNNIIYQSGNYSVPLNGSVFGVTEKTKVNIEAGEYWLSFHGGPINTTGYMQAVGYELTGKVSTPEPATMLLMGGGLAGMFWRRRKILKI